MTTATKKKISLIHLALVFGIILVAADLGSFITTLALQQPALFPTAWTAPLMASFFLLPLPASQLMHMGAFFLSLLGYVYANESDDSWAVGMARLSYIVNIVAMVGRVTFELAFVDYRPAAYSEG